MWQVGILYFFATKVEKTVGKIEILTKKKA